MEYLNVFQDLALNIARLDFTKGAPFFVIMLLLSLYCCMEGFRVFRLILMVGGFMFGFYFASTVLEKIGITGTLELIIEVVFAIILAALSFKLVAAGVFTLVFWLGLTNIPVFLSNLNAWGVEFKALPQFVIYIIAAVLAAIAGFAVMKATRPVIVVVTAVFGAFMGIEAFKNLLIYLPVGTAAVFPEPTSFVWTIAKILLSAAGAGIQGVNSSSSKNTL